MKKNATLLFTIFMIIGILVFSGCKRNYYKDTGLTDPNFKGTMMDYFNAKPMQFDTLVQVIKLSGLEKYFTDSSFTFFAPADASIRVTFDYINNRLKSFGRDSLTSLQSIKPEFWSRILKLYMFRGIRGLEDYPQLDYKNRQSLSGEFVTSLSNQTMNVGTVFTDADGLKYKGARFLTINYVPSNSSPYEGWVSAYVASSNIRPSNGILHAVMYSEFPFSGSSYNGIPAHAFGFNTEQAWLIANYLGFN